MTINPKPRAGERTKGLWRAHAGLNTWFVAIEGATHSRLLTMSATEPYQEANARRIAACVNACEGLPDGWVEHNSVKERLAAGADLQAERDQLREQNKELVQFAEVVRDWYENAGNADPDSESPGSQELWSKARSILAKARP